MENFDDNYSRVPRLLLVLFLGFLCAIGHAPYLVLGLTHTFPSTKIVIHKTDSSPNSNIHHTAQKHNHAKTLHVQTV